MSAWESSKETRKNTVLSLSFHHIHLTLQQVISTFFYFLQITLNDKNFFQEDQVKMFVEKFLSLKPVEFYLKGINKLDDKW